MKAEQGRQQKVPSHWGPWQFSFKSNTLINTEHQGYEVDLNTQSPQETLNWLFHIRVTKSWPASWMGHLVHALVDLGVLDPSKYAPPGETSQRPNESREGSTFYVSPQTCSFCRKGGHNTRSCHEKRSAPPEDILLRALKTEIDKTLSLSNLSGKQAGINNLSNLIANRAIGSPA